MGWLQDLVGGMDHHTDALAANGADHHVHAHHALVPIAHTDHHADGGGHTHIAMADVVLAPGGSALEHHMACPDPLTDLEDFAFPCYTHRQDSGALVDLDGDGVMDCTAWGTPVTRVDDYVRADGTVVHGHYRTVANGCELDNLRR